MFGAFRLFSDIDVAHDVNVHTNEYENNPRTDFEGTSDFLTTDITGADTYTTSSSSTSPTKALNPHDTFMEKEEDGGGGGDGDGDAAEDLENRLFNILFKQQSIEGVEEGITRHHHHHNEDTSSFDEDVSRVALGEEEEEEEEAHHDFERLVRRITFVSSSPSEEEEDDKKMSKGGGGRPRKRSSIIAALDADKLSSPLPESSRRRRSTVTSLDEDYASLLSPSILEGTSNLQLSSPMTPREEEEEEEEEERRKRRTRKMFKERTIIVSSSPRGSSHKSNLRRRKHVRGSYRCRLCGLPKKNHKCMFAPKVKPRKKKREKQKATVACQASFDDTMTIAYLKYPQVGEVEGKMRIQDDDAFETSALALSPGPSPRPLLAGISCVEFDRL